MAGSKQVQTALQRYPVTLKIISVVVSFLFIWHQILWATPVQEMASANLRPVVDLAQAENRVSSSAEAKQKISAAMTDFPQADQVLQPVDEADESVSTPKMALAASAQRLSDGTLLDYEDGHLKKETASDGTRYDFFDDQSISRVTLSSGTSFSFSKDNSKITVQSANLPQSLEISSPNDSIPASDQTLVMTTKLEGGVEILSWNGVPREIHTQDGTRIVDFLLKDDGGFQYTWLVNPDGSKEFYWEEKLVRRIDSTGVVFDFSPDGRQIRIISQEETQNFIYQKNSSGSIEQTLLKSSKGTWVSYDSKGMIREVHGEKGLVILYRGYKKGSSYRLRLISIKDPENKITNPAQNIWYDSNKEVEEIEFRDGSRVEFEQGKAKHFFNAQGNQSTLEAWKEAGVYQGLILKTQQTTTFVNSKGFMDSLKTKAGKMERYETQSGSTDLAVKLSDGGALSEILWDDQGNMASALWTKADGIRVRMQSGQAVEMMLTDGRVYAVNGEISTLKRWEFVDGSVIHFKENRVEDLVLASGKRLHSFVFDAQGKLQSFKTTLSDQSQITYDGNGDAVRYLPSNLTAVTSLVEPWWGEESISRIFENGNLKEIMVSQRDLHQFFDLQGNLLRAESQGVRVDYLENQPVKVKTPTSEMTGLQVESDGSLTGDVTLSDGRRLRVEKGSLVRSTSEDGLVIEYANGQPMRAQKNGIQYEIFESNTKHDLFWKIRVTQNGSVTEEDMTSYLLSHPENPLHQVVLGQKLFDLIDPSHVVQTLLNGEEISLANRKIIAGESALQISGTYFPELLNADMGLASTNEGYVSTNLWEFANDDMPGLSSTVIDMDGDHLPDRVWVQSVGDTFWWFQKNNGTSFGEKIKWEGVVDLYERGLGQAMVYYNNRRPQVMGDLRDMNGDGLPDRVLVKGSYDNWDLKQNYSWMIQINNGHGFNPPEEWNNIVAVDVTAAGGKFAIRGKNDKNGRPVQEVISDLIDMDGDGLLDRVIRPSTPVIREGQACWDNWWFQKNTGHGYLDSVQWTGVDATFDSDPQTGLSLSWYEQDGDAWMDRSLLKDMNGDHRPDRILTKKTQDPAGKSRLEWYIQWNSGSGFSAVELFTKEVRSFSGATDGYYATSPYSFAAQEGHSRRVTSLLEDVTGDGLPDRITANRSDQVLSVWWVEENTGKSCAEVKSGETCGFKQAVAWSGIYGETLDEVAITKDTDHFRSWPCVHGEDCGAGRTPTFVQTRTDLLDMNQDGLLDRVIFSLNKQKWFVQFGTGHGFLPVEELKQNGISANLFTENETAQTLSSSSQVAVENNLPTQFYDSMHLRLKADSSTASGSFQVSLFDPSHPEAKQTWSVSNPGTEWKDIYLPLSHGASSASKMEVIWVFNTQNEGGVSAPPVIFAKDITFISHKSSEQWEDQMLTKADALKGLIQKKALITSQEFFKADLLLPLNFDWKKILDTESQIVSSKDAAHQTIQDLGGSSFEIENGTLISAKLTDGTQLTTTVPDAAKPGAKIETIETLDGAKDIRQIQDDRVRTSAKTGVNPLTYTYTFEDGKEIQNVTDTTTSIMESYDAGKLIRRTFPSGVIKEFIYNAAGNLTETRMGYGKRIDQIFYHSRDVKTGLEVVTLENGLKEYYSADQKLLYHETADGFLYKHEQGNAESYSIQEKALDPIVLADGKTLQLTVPVLVLSPSKDSGTSSTLIEAVSLDRFRAKDGTEVQYQDGEIKSITLPDGTRIEITGIDTKDVLQSNGIDAVREKNLAAVRVIHPEGYVTEFKDRSPDQVITAQGKIINIRKENNVLIDTSDAAKMQSDRSTALWQDVESLWKKYELAPSQEIKMERTSGGQILTKHYAEGTIELYDQGQVSMIVSSQSEIMARYTYDRDNNPIRIDLEGSKRRLEAEVLSLRAETQMKTQEAKLQVIEKQQISDQMIRGQYEVNRDRLLALRAQIEKAREDLQGVPAKGKQTRSIVAEGMRQIEDGMNQVNTALGNLEIEIKKLQDQLKDEITKAFENIETESQKAFEEIAKSENNSKYAILLNETLPVISRWYENILGRSPSREEINKILGIREVEKDVTTAEGKKEKRKDFEYDPSPYLEGDRVLNLEKLKIDLKNSEEYRNTSWEVQFIKDEVIQKLSCYAGLSKSPACNDKAWLENFLGVSGSAELVTLTPAEAQKIVSWISARSLHFGQSAYLSFEALLDEAGFKKVTAKPSPETDHTYTRRDLAERLILIDILTGVISPIEDDKQDLLISFHAMQVLAKKWKPDLDLSAMRLSYEGLKQLYQETCAGKSDCQFRAVLHVDGNHFIIVTKIEIILDPVTGEIKEEKITYTDSGAGPANALAVMVVDKATLLAKWAQPGSGVGGIQTPEGPWGYVLMNHPVSLDTKLAVKLTVRESMRVRGAGFWLIFIAIAAAASAIASAVTAVVTAIVATIVALISAIAGFIAGIMSGLVGMFQAFGAFFTNMGLMEGFKGFLVGMGNSFGAFGGAFVNAAEAFQGAFGSVFSLLNPSLQGAVTSFFAPSATFGLKLELASTLLGSIGVSPKLQNALFGSWELGAGLFMLGTGNPAGLLFVAKGGASVVQSAFNLPSWANQVLSVGATALGVFGAGFLGGGMNLGWELLKKVSPVLIGDLTMAGISGLGSALGWDPRITGLISIPVSAGISGAVGGGVNTKKTWFQGVKDALKKSVGGMVSVGINIGLNQLGLPSGSLDLITQFFNGFSKTQAGSDLKALMGGVFGKISEGFQKFSSMIVNGAENVISFGAKALGDLGKMTEDSFRNAIGSFKSIFSRETQENIHRDEIKELKGTVTTEGSKYIWTNQDSRITYDGSTGVVTENVAGVGGGTLRIEGLSQDGKGDVHYEKLDSTSIMSDGWLKTEYQKGSLENWSYQYQTGEEILVELDQANAENLAAIRNGGVENGTVSIHIPGVDDDPKPNPNPELPPLEWSYKNKIIIPIKDGKGTQGQLETSSGSGTTNGTSEQSNQPLFVLTNGINNQNLNILTPPNYINNLEKDLYDGSNHEILYDSFIPTPVYPGTKVDTGPFKNPNALANQIKDILQFFFESQVSVPNGTVTPLILFHLAKAFFGNAKEWVNRRIIGVGYSGGFAPMVEALKTSPYVQQLKTLIGLGAATVDISNIPKEALLALSELTAKIEFGITDGLNLLVEKTLGFLPKIGEKLAKMGRTVTGVVDSIFNFVKSKAVDPALDLIGEITKAYVDALPAIGPASLQGTPVDFVVNLWGEDDILNTFKIGGYREQIGGYTPSDKLKPLFNIQIMSGRLANGSKDPNKVADHFNYMRDVGSTKWDDEVSKFVAELIIQSKKSKDDFRIWLETNPLVQPKSNGFYEVIIP